MPKTVSLFLSPRQAADPEAIGAALSRSVGRSLPPDRYVIRRRSIDARKRPIRVSLGIDVYADGELIAPVLPEFAYQDVHQAPPVMIVGAGPAGLFAALRLLELGIKPVVIERGKAVGPRRRDVAALNRRGVLNVESNYAFGEGGAGTFSDGKLYTRSKKRGDYHRVLQCLCWHGADPDILTAAHPHIGSNRLPGIVQTIRETIIGHGGEIHFQQQVTELSMAGGRASGVTLKEGGHLDAKAVILATGHSARDSYALLTRKGGPCRPRPLPWGCGWNIPKGSSTIFNTMASRGANICRRPPIV